MGPIAARSQPASLGTSLVRRTLEGLLTAWTAVSLAFFALRLSAGDPVASLLSQGLASSEQAALLRTRLGLDAPLFLQYLRFLAGLLRGDLGNSLYSGRSVAAVIGDQLPATLQLAGSGFLIALLLGLGLGILAAFQHGRLLGRLAETAASAALALPVTVTGVLAILLSTSTGRQLFQGASLLWLNRLLLPALVLGFASCGPIARITQSGLRESLHAPYFMAARARGIGRGWPRLKHALRPALPALIAIAGLQAGFLLAGTVVTETVFSRPGMGRLLVSAILQGDFAVAQGVVVLAAIFFTLTQLSADLLAMGADPRLRSA